MSAKSEIHWPAKATHARQLVDGVSVVVRRDNFDTLIPGKSFDFGIWRERQFVLVPKDAPVPVAAPVVVTAAGMAPVAAAAPAGFVVRQEGRPVIPWPVGSRRHFMAEMILDGDKTAREIAAFVVERWPDVAIEKAYAHVRATKAHLKVAGINASFRKVGGPPVINY